MIPSMMMVAVNLILSWHISPYGAMSVAKFKPSIKKWSDIEVNDQPYNYYPDRVEAIVWPTPIPGSPEENKFTFPEKNDELPVGRWLNERPNLGIAISGGGLRAATCALGWLRGLNSLKVLQKARYLAVNSGATWTTLPLAIKDLLSKKEATEMQPEGVDIDLEYYLGKHMKPEDIKGDSSELGVLGEVIRDSNILDTARLNKDPSYFTNWIKAIDENFVNTKKLEISNKPDFYKDLSDAYLWNRKDQYKILNEKRLPFTLYCGTAYTSKTRRFPFEFSLLYAGIPVNDDNGTNIIRSGYVQCTAFDSDIQGVEAVENFDDSGKAINIVTVPRPKSVIKIAEITGISSSFWGAASITKLINVSDYAKSLIFKFLSILGKNKIGTIEGFLNPAEYKFWSPSPIDSKKFAKSNDLKFVDGGVFDNTGIIALLRRGVRTIIACIATDSEVSDHDADNAAHFTDFASLFGQAPNDYDPVLKSKYNEYEQVFEDGKAGWDDLIKSLKDKKDDVNIVCKKLTVKPNHAIGVHMTGPVTVYFCVNRRVPNWINKVGNKNLANKMKNGFHQMSTFKGPENDLDAIAKDIEVLEGIGGEHKLTEEFPYISTFRVKYDQDLVNMLVHQCSYSIVEGLKGIDFSKEKLPE